MKKWHWPGGVHIVDSHDLRSPYFNVGWEIRSVEVQPVDPFLLFKMFLRPVVFWLIAVAVYWYLRVFVAGSFSASSYLTGLAEGVTSNAIWIALVPFAFGSLILLQRIHLLYSWHSDDTLGCGYCGAPQEEKTGRYGWYRKCFRCGETKRGWK